MSDQERLTSQEPVEVSATPSVEPVTEAATPVEAAPSVDVTGGSEPAEKASKSKKAPKGKAGAAPAGKATKKPAAKKRRVLSEAAEQAPAPVTEQVVAEGPVPERPAVERSERAADSPAPEGAAAAEGTAPSGAEHPSRKRTHRVRVAEKDSSAESVAPEPFAVDSGAQSAIDAAESAQPASRDDRVQEQESQPMPVQAAPGKRSSSRQAGRTPAKPVEEMDIDELMGLFPNPRRGRGRPSKRDKQVRQVRDALANVKGDPSPEALVQARALVTAVLAGAASSSDAAEPDQDRPRAEESVKASGEVVDGGTDQPAEQFVTEPSEGSYGTRRRRHERRDDRSQQGQQLQGDRPWQKGQDGSQQRRDRGFDQQRQRDGRDNRTGSQRDRGFDQQRQRDGKNGQNAQQAQGRDQQFGGKNNRKNNRQRDFAAEPKTNREELEELKVGDLRIKASELGIDPAGLKKPELVDAVYSALVKQEGFFEFTGILDLNNDGVGYVRTRGYLGSEDDVYVSAGAVRANALRRGDEVSGIALRGRATDKFPGVTKVTAVNGRDPEEARNRPRFGDLTPVFPSEPLKMEHGRDSILGRCMDLVSPVGKGQRGLIVSPPKAGKTTVLKKIAESIAANNPEVHLICLLVDERPEEVTDMQRSIRGEVVASTFDMPCDNHITVAELVIERAKRLVEQGEDVVILLDSITRLARAYNLAQPASGRILSGGVDSTALYPPKRFLGAARNIENGGSLTILASALVDTGSKMDEVIFEEFKGTGNMELKLDRDLADRRIFPAIDPVASGTRKEELLLDPNIAPFVWGVRRILANMNNNERAMTSLIKSLKATASNEEFLIRSAKKAQMQETGSADL